MRRAALAALSAIAIAVAFPSSAGAAISGPCSATLNGESVDAGHDSAGTAIDVDYRETIPVEGAVAGGTATDVTYKLKVAGYSKSVGEDINISSDRKTWTGRVNVKDYAWAAVGLYEVVGTASTSAGLCEGTVYVCVTGKNPVTTAAGGVGAGLGLLGAIGVARNLLTRRPMTPVQSFVRTGRGGFAGLLGGVVLLQQGCVLPLTPATLAGSALGGLLLFGLLGLIFTKLGRGAEPAAPATIPAGAPLAPKPGDEPDRRDGQPVIYQFTAAPGACKACVAHAQNRVYSKQPLMRRAHPGCRCQITSITVQDAAYQAYFQEGYIYDRRQPVG